jgi:hypothetical protein
MRDSTARTGMTLEQLRKGRREILKLDDQQDLPQICCDLYGVEPPAIGGLNWCGREDLNLRETRRVRSTGSVPAPLPAEDPSHRPETGWCQFPGQCSGQEDLGRLGRSVRSTRAGLPARNG